MDPKVTHADAYDPACEICASPAKGIIEARYTACQDVREICKEFFVQREQLNQHVRALDLDIVRLNNTDKIAGRLLDYGLEQLADGNLEVTADHILRILEHKDKKEGRIVNRVSVEKPSTVVFRNIPSPLAVADDNGQPLALKPAPESEAITAPETEKESE